MQRLVRPERPLSTRSLPQQRRDEVGQISRCVHNLAVSAIRDHHEANRLRRTLDSRIEQATRRATNELTQIAMRDPLTNLANRRFLDQHLEELTRSCAASNTDLVCVLLDMDDFKQVNDVLGHAAGDDLLCFAAMLIRASIRDDDVAVRLGGDEFVVLMPGCEIERAGQFADRVKKLFAEHVQLTLADDIDARPDFSIGVSSLLRDGAASGAELIEIADTNLYSAKAGRKGATIGLW
jgi:diguanylate cyclase (GGDEF)-like protein